MAAGMVPVLSAGVVLLVLLVPAAADGSINSRRPDLLPANCGRRFAQPGGPGTPAGAGNTTAEHGLFPWQARLEVEAAPGYVRHCGGVIITRHHVLAAASCVHHVPARSVVVRVGDWRAGVGDQQEFAVAGIQVHSGFRHGAGFANDIALLRLQEGAAGIAFGRSVQPACLPEPGAELEAGTACEVSGWSSRAVGVPDRPETVSLPLLTDQLCSAREVHQRWFVSGQMVCAGLICGVRCAEDAPGPLVCQDPASERHIAYGILSGRECSVQPGLYTKVSAFVDWILPRLQLESDVTAEDPDLITGAAGCGRSDFALPADTGAAFAERTADFPWLVTVHSSEQQGRMVCTGAILSDRWVMTSATCVRDDDSLEIKSAVLDLETETPDLKLNVTRAVKHPMFLPPETRSYDVALLRTATPIPFFGGPRPLCLPGPLLSEITSGRTVIAAGWGPPDYAGDQQRLKWAKMTVVDGTVCRQNVSSLLGKERVDVFLSEDTFCTVQDQLSEPFDCAINLGDQGTPLTAAVEERGVRRWYALGMHVAGDPRCPTRYPGINVALKSSAEWIMSVIAM